MEHNGITHEILGMQVLKCTCHEMWILDGQEQEGLQDEQLVQVLVEIAQERVRTLTPDVLASWARSALSMDQYPDDKDNLRYIDDRRKELQQMIEDFEILEVRKIYG